VKTISEFARRHLDISQDPSERTDFQRSIAMHGDGGPQVALGKEVMATADAKQLEPFAL
jgi:hypothetical protein